MVGARTHFTVSTNSGRAAYPCQNLTLQQREQARGHERSPPDQVEVEPSLTEHCEAEPAIERPRNQACDGKVADRVDSRCEHSC